MYLVTAYYGSRGSEDQQTGKYFLITLIYRKKVLIELKAVKSLIPEHQGGGVRFQEV